jgi:tetratricopeptide (TPR) repeat protein
MTGPLTDDAVVYDFVRAALTRHIGRAQVASFVGEAWLLVTQARAAVARGELEAPERLEDLDAFVAPLVKQAVGRVGFEQREATSKSGVFGVHLDGALRFLHPDGEGSPVCEDVDAKALWQRAFDRAPLTMQRNLGWWQRRKVDLEAFADIAASGEEPVAESTVRGGVAKAERFLRKVQDELRGEPWQSGRVDYADVHAAYLARDEARLEQTLARRAPYERDAQLMNYEGILLLWRGRLEEARQVLRDALVYADGTTLRCLVTNNLGNVEEEAGAYEDALYWFDRARGLNPRAPTPLLNMLGVVCKRARPELQLQDHARLLHYVDCITKLLSSRGLPDEDRAYLLRRLAQNPDFQPARLTPAWKRIRRWLRKNDLLPSEHESEAPAAKQVRS